MHLIGSNNGTDGWINSETAYDGMKKPRRTSVAPWKKVVNNFDDFKVATKEKYVFAEDMFCNVAENLGMQPEQCMFCTCDDDLLDEKYITRLYFEAHGI